MNVQQDKLAVRYQEFADDYRRRSLKALAKLSLHSSISGVTATTGFLVQEQLANPALKIAVAAGALAITGANLKSAFVVVQHETMLHEEYHHFKDLVSAESAEPTRS